MNEMAKLELYLYKHNYRFERFIEFEVIDKKITEKRNQIIVSDIYGVRKWDAICQQGSYGFEKGLIEIIGIIVSQDYEDDVEGYLTADEIINRLERLKGGA